jgi:hypothetical protein
VSLHVALGYFTLVGLLSPDPHTLVRTILLVHVLDALVCRVLALNNRRAKNLWTALGLLFGIWALAVLLLLPRQEVQRTVRP